MQLSINKTRDAAAIVIFLLMASVMLLEMPVQPVKAQTQPSSGSIPPGVTPDFTVTTTAYMSIRPAVVGLGQTFIVNLFPIPAPNAARKFKDFKVTITKPTGDPIVITMDSYVADGTAWFEYIANELGTWKFKFEMPGQYFPAGRYLDGAIVTSGGTNYPQSAYYKPSATKEMSITVQQDIVYSYPDLGLPNDYWTRPVPYEHREWAPISGDFPWRGPSGGDVWDELYPDTNPYWGGYSLTGMGGPWRGHFTPWVQAPNTAHVTWKQQYAIGGIIGGDYGSEIADANIFGSSGVGRFPIMVYAGMAYITRVKPGTGKAGQTYWQCYDYRTGQLIWERPLEAGESAPTVIEYSKGLLPGGQVSIDISEQHITAVSLLSISDGYLRKYDPWTGRMVTNVSIAPMAGSGGTYYMNGYVLGVQTIGSGASAQYCLINWTTLGTSSNFTSRIWSNVTWPWNSLPDTTDYQVGIAARTSKSFVAGAPNKTEVMAASLETGRQLWSVALDEWEYSSVCNYADHGKIAILTEQGYFIALDLYTGRVVWKSDRLDYPWDEPGFGGYNVLSAYGLLYRNAYTGVYAFNWTNGKLAWKYTSPAAATYETPYVNTEGLTVYSTNIGGGIADGKYYIYNTEHSATVPITRGWQLHCINATTGEGIWKVALPGGGSKHTTDIGPIADGYLSVGGSDGYMYVFGKGKSATAVTAPDTEVSLGTAVTIKGTVMDLSPAQPNTPCVSPGSMALQMEYLHKQLPINGIWHNETTMTGVSVYLSAIDPNGNPEEIGAVTTNPYYGTFSKAWTPKLEGAYTIIAAFAGDASYGSSSAATAITVGPAPTPAPTTEPEPAPDYTWTIVGTGIAIIIVVIIATILVLRKHP